MIKRIEVTTEQLVSPTRSAAADKVLRDLRGARLLTDGIDSRVAADFAADDLSFHQLARKEYGSYYDKVLSRHADKTFGLPQGFVWSVMGSNRIYKADDTLSDAVDAAALAPINLTPARLHDLRTGTDLYAVRYQLYSAAAARTRAEEEKLLGVFSGGLVGSDYFTHRACGISETSCAVVAAALAAPIRDWGTESHREFWRSGSPRSISRKFEVSGSRWPPLYFLHDGGLLEGDAIIILR